ncbi:MAG TPA: 16S rRNA (guanine(966)-N(2))-methyltransferase RsmD [Spirochaetia bacterium]|nr:16S rRNA (guanine(966)-N(2))-methyltransferase RsmD [Spirochaetia bacterium]
MSKLRVTGGRYVRRRIDCPPGEIRPAMDRMRESLFSILGDLAGASFLDLFSGSGIIGIEAASRRASPVVLVEGDAGKRRTILANIAFVDSEIDLRIMPAERYLAAARRRFDYVFLDPPFRYPRKVLLIEQVEQRKVLAQGGTLLIHHPRGDDLPERIGGLSRSDVRVYGGSIVDFFRWEVSDR